MSRLTVLIVAAVLIIGALVLLSTLPRQRPVSTIEVDVPQGGNAS